jgi:Ricin-type beta-trefoil lectin domain
MLISRVLLVTAALLLAGPAGPAVAVPAPPPLHQGWIVTGQTPSRCLTGGVAGTVLHTAACDRADKDQDFYQTSDGHFTQGENCVQPNSTGSRAVVARCTYRAHQNWWFTTTLQAGGQQGRCLTELSVDAVGVGKVRLRACSGAANQRWRSVNPW